MGRAIAVKTDYSGAEVRRLAKRTKDAAQARRLLAVAAILDGASREEAAKTGRYWTARRLRPSADCAVIRFNRTGTGRSDKYWLRQVLPPSSTRSKAFLYARIVDGPGPPRNPCVVRLAGLRSDHAAIRAEFALSVSDDTIYRAMVGKNWRFSHRECEAARAYKHDAAAIDAFEIQLFRTASPNGIRKGSVRSGGNVWTTLSCSASGIFAICCDLTRPTITRLAPSTSVKKSRRSKTSTCRWSHCA